MKRVLVSVNGRFSAAAFNEFLHFLMRCLFDCGASSTAALNCLSCSFQICLLGTLDFSNVTEAETCFKLMVTTLNFSHLGKKSSISEP